MNLVEHVESFVMNELMDFLSVLFAALFCYILSYLQLIFLFIVNNTELLSFNRKYSETETAGSLISIAKI